MSMAKYRKRPVVIEAVLGEWSDWLITDGSEASSISGVPSPLVTESDEAVLLDQEFTDEVAPVAEHQSEPVQCPRCRATQWDVYPLRLLCNTERDPDGDEITVQEVRCHACGHAASLFTPEGKAILARAAWVLRRAAPQIEMLLAKTEGGSV